jgi:surfeit locus 1 family protein
MLAERQQKLAATPVSLQELLANKAQAHRDQEGSPSAGDLEFRRVQLTGKYDTGRSLYVGPRVKSAPGGMTEKGYHVVTPLVPSDERAPAVLVNRGWVPNDWTEDKEGPTSGREVTVCGVVRGSDQPSQFVPANVPEAEQVNPNH